MNSVCTFRMEGRDFERKKIFCQNWENNKKKHILLFIIGKIFKEFIYLHNLGNYLKKKWSRNFYRRKFIQYNNRGINVFLNFFGGMGDCSVDSGSCADNVFLFSSPIS